MSDLSSSDCSLPERGRDSQNGCGLLLIISGPSGVGKTTITREVVERLNAVFSVSMTTRPMTAKDTDGVDYFFVDRAVFDAKVAAGEMLEWAEVFDRCYGTPRGPVEAAMGEGKTVILEIDVEGAAQVKEKMPEAFAIFVDPPSEAELLKRLRLRAREDEATIQKRFGQARREISRARETGAYDVFIVNDDLERAIDEAVAAVKAAVERRAGSGVG